MAKAKVVKNLKREVVKEETATGGSEVIRVGEKEFKVSTKEETAFNKSLELEAEEKEKLPIDKLVGIADRAGLLPQQSQEEKWQHFIKGIRLYDIVKDCMQSSMNNFCLAYNKANPEDQIGFKLHVRKNVKGNNIFGVDLVLEMKRYGSFKTVFKKHVDFRHVREIKDETNWKYALYGEMLNELIGTGLAFILIKDDHDSGRIKP